MFNMSYNEALLIQRAQMVYYRQRIGLKGVRAIKRRTTPCPPDLHPNEKISTIVINRLVPRGGDFENLPMNRKVKVDETNVAWHDAIRRELF